MSRKPIPPETCPIHQVELIERANPVGPGRIRLCPVETCTMPATLLKGKPAQFKLPGMEPGLQQNRATWPERQTEAEVDAYCRQQGIPALVTTVQYKMQTCPQCGHRHRPQGGYGADRGVPDFLLLPDFLPSYLAVMLEIKGSETRLSPEQRDLHERGKIAIARSAQDVERILDLIETSLQRIIKPER